MSMSITDIHIQYQYE